MIWRILFYSGGVLLALSAQPQSQIGVAGALLVIAALIEAVAADNDY